MAYPDSHQQLVDKLRTAAQNAKAARDASQAAALALSASTPTGTRTATPSTLQPGSNQLP